MEGHDKFIIISSYRDEVKYYNDVIDGKEHRAPIFTGNDFAEDGKSIFTRMVQNGDIDRSKLDNYLNKTRKF